MWNQRFSNDLSGLETSLPQSGHLARLTSQYNILPYRKECQQVEDMLAQLDTTNENMIIQGLKATGVSSGTVEVDVV